MSSEIFKEYDIRGIYPDQINKDVVRDIIKNFKEIFGPKKKVIIGHDDRKSSPLLYKTAVEEFKHIGYEVYVVGMITTPMLMFLADRFKADISINITASHNPNNQNGIKVIGKNLNIIGGTEIYEKIKGASYCGNIEKIGKIIKKEKEAKSSYINFLNNLFNKNLHRKIKIVIDCMHGSAGPIISKIKFPDYVKTILLNEKPNGNFSFKGPNPMLDNSLVNTKNAVKKNKADFGVVFDGDGDRIVFINDKSERVRPEYIWRLISNHKKSLLSELNIYLLRKMIEREQAQDELFISRIGRISFIRGMKKNNCEIGFENSGHYYFKDFFYSDSGIITLIKSINSFSVLPYKFSEFIDMLPKTFRAPEHTIGRSIDAKRDNKLDNMFSKISKEIGPNARKISFLDGVSIYFNDLFINLRKSNTEEVVRINVEGDDKGRVYKTLKKTVNTTKKYF